MLETNIKAVNNDVKALIADSQALFSAAASLTGEKAEEVRKSGMRMLDAALQQAQAAQACAFSAGKKMAVSTGSYVKENPWYSMGAAVGLGLLLGAIIRRKK